jgi:tetratricopeptide (TPR) repeat protein
MRLQLAALLLAYSLAGCGSDYYARKHAEERADERATLTQQIESGQLHDVALAQAYMNRGHSWLRSEDFVRAMADFDQAVAAAPAFPEAYFARAKLRLQLADFPGAEADASQVVALLPDYPAPRLYLAQIWGLKGEDARAIAAYDEELARDPNLWAALVLRGATLAKIREDDRALADLDRGSALASAEISSRNAKSGSPPGTIVMTGDLEADAAYLNDLIVRSHGVQARGKVLFRKGLYERALADLDTSEGESLIYRGLSEMALGRCRDGYGDLRRASNKQGVDVEQTLALQKDFIDRTKCADYLF